MIDTNELGSLDEVGQQLLAVAVVDGQPQEVVVLDEVGFRTIGADVDLVADLVVLQANDGDPLAKSIVSFGFGP